MKNDRAHPLLMIMWFQHPANTTISGWQQSKDLHFTFYIWILRLKSNGAVPERE